MSALKIIEKAALSLPGEDQRQLLVFMTDVVEAAAARRLEAVPEPPPQNLDGLHPALLPMVGIIPAEAEAEEIHGYRLLKHA